MTSMPTLPPPSPLPLPLPLPPASTSPSSSSRHVPFGMSEALNQSIIETLTKSLNALHKHQRLGTSSSTPDLPNLEENDSVMESAPTAPASTKAKKKHKEDEDEGGEHHCRFQSLGCRHKPYKHAGVCLTKHQEICKYNPALAHLRGKRRSMGSIGNGHGITGVGPSQPSQPIPIGSSSSILSQSPSPSLSPASSFSPAGPSSFPRPQSVPNSMSIMNGTSPRQHPLSHTIQPLSLSTSTSHTQLPFTAPVTPTSSIPSPLASPSSSTSSYQPVKRDSISATSSPLGSPRRVPYNRSARTSISGTSGTPSSRMPRSHSSLRFSTSGATSPVSQPRSIAALSSPRLASSQGPVAAHPALANLPSPNLHGHVAPSPFQFPSTTPPTSNGITRNRSSPSSVASLAASTAAAASAALAMQQQHALRQQEAAHSITTRTPSPVALPHIPHIVLPSQQVSSTNLSPIHHHLSRVNLNADNIYGEIANKTQTLNDMMASIIKDEHFVIPESLPISQPETVLGALNAESRYHQQQQQTTATTSHDYTIQPLSQLSSSHDYTVQPLSPNYMNPLTVTSEHSDNSDLSIHTSSNPRSPDTMITDSMSSLSDNISMSSNSFSQHSQSSSTTSIQSQDINIPSIESSCDFPIFPSYSTKDINDTFDSCHELTSSHDWNHTNMDYFLADQPNNSTWNTFQ